MTQSNEEHGYFLNDVLGAYLRQKFKDANAAMDWARPHGINPSTMRDVYYKNGKCGREVFNQIITKLFNITPEKTASILDQIISLEPIPESQKIWNSIHAPEVVKRRLALVAKATIEIEESLNKNK